MNIVYRVGHKSWELNFHTKVVTLDVNYRFTVYYNMASVHTDNMFGYLFFIVKASQRQVRNFCGPPFFPVFFSLVYQLLDNECKNIEL